MMRETCFTLVVCCSLACYGESLPAAPRDELAVVAVPAMSKDSQYLQLYLENRSARPIELVDIYQPGWTAFHWFKFRVDGKPIEIFSRGAYSLGSLKGEKRTFPPKSKTYIDSVFLHTPAGKNPGGYTTELKLKPGKHFIEISSKPEIQPTKLEITILEKPMAPNPALPKNQSPLQLTVTHGPHERNALKVIVHVQNLTDQTILIPHHGEEPPWHTAPWFDLEINGKPFSFKVPPTLVKDEKGMMEWRPLEDRYRGEFLIPLHGFDEKFFKHNYYYTPVLPLAPGKYTLRVLPTKRWNQPGITPPAPASIEIVVPAMAKEK